LFWLGGSVTIAVLWQPLDRCISGARWDAPGQGKGRES
jgi:hypothetical protein